jgi:hypothetical protein
LRLVGGIIAGVGKEGIMSRRRRYLQLALVALIMLISASSGSIARADEDKPGDDDHTTVERSSTIIPVAWEMTPARCYRLKATTRGAGDMKEDTVINRHADGSIDVFVSDVVSGKANDDNGVSYKWSYTNHQHARIPAAPNNDRVYILMSDFFTLNRGGKNGSAPFTIGLVWRWNYTNAGDIPPFTGQWPPERDLVKISTVGNFTVTPTGLDCDPV